MRSTHQFASSLPQPARLASFIFSPPDQQMLETLSNRARNSKEQGVLPSNSVCKFWGFAVPGTFAPRFRILWQFALSLFLLCKLSQRESSIRRIINHFMGAHNAQQQIFIAHLPSAMPAALDNQPRTSQVWFSPPP